MICPYSKDDIDAMIALVALRRAGEGRTMVDVCSKALRTTKWPDSDLERCFECPACGHNRRALLHDDLWDGSFQTAPGRWALWRCARCRSAYLDPRPTEASIGRAYSAYYTHGSQAAEPKKLGIAALKEALGNGYRNWRYGTDLKPSSSLGIAIGLLAPRTRRLTDYLMRYLPRERGMLLDVGCGNGDFLVKAVSAGWSAHGCDTDTQAVAGCRARGADAREGNVEAWRGAKFDAITMNHVIEHVHDPRATMLAVFDLLKPGGFLYIETPNIDATTYERFGADWRGLEIPRHLCIFAHQALVALLQECGFVIFAAPKGPSPAEFLVRESRRIMALSDRAHPVAIENDTRLGAMPAEDRTEFITLLCRRPLG